MGWWQQNMGQETGTTVQAVESIIEQLEQDNASLRAQIKLSGAVSDPVAAQSAWLLADERPEDGENVVAELVDGSICGGGFRFSPEMHPQWAARIETPIGPVLWSLVVAWTSCPRRCPA